MAGRDDWEWSTILERRATRLGRRFDQYKMQEQGQVSCPFAAACHAEKSSSDSKSDFAAVFVPPEVKTGSMVSSSVSLGTSMSALEQSSERYFRIYDCKSTEILSAKGETPWACCERRRAAFFDRPDL